MSTGLPTHDACQGLSGSVESTPVRGCTNAPSTNSGARPPVFVMPDPEVTGVDTVRLVGRVADHSIKRWRSLSTVDVEGVVHERITSNSSPLPDADLLVRHTTRGMEAVIERSLPNMRWGHNMFALSAGEAVAAITELHDQASQVVDWIDDARQLRITRLDLDRDFSRVTALDAILSGLARLPVRRAAVATLHISPHGAIGLERGTRSRTWRALLYDKEVQAAALRSRRDAPRLSSPLSDDVVALASGRVRYEVQLRADILRRKGLRTVSDLHQSAINDLARDFFHRARFDAPVAGPSRIEAVQRHLATSRDPDYKYFGQVIGMLHADALGVQPPASSPTTLSRYRKLAAEWDLTPNDLRAGTLEQPIMLDYATGRISAA